MSKVKRASQTMFGLMPTIFGCNRAFGEILAKEAEAQRLARESKVSKRMARPNLKLSDDQVVEIRRLREGPNAPTYSALAETYSVTPEYIKRICAYSCRVKSADGSFGLC